jgi:hypothetical protein
MPSGRALLGLLVSLLLSPGCNCQRIPQPYLGPPGTTETHVLVEVRRGVVDGDVWRLKSTVTLEGVSRVQLLPEEPPSEPLSFPATYKVLARDRSGVVLVTVEGLADDGRTVARASGSVELVANRGVQLALDLGHACGADPDCDDGEFCSGVERCLDGVCTRGERACPPSIHACVEITCVEEARACVTVTHDEQCGVPSQDGGLGESRYCDAALGCLAGRRDAPMLVGDAIVAPAVGRVGALFSVAFVVSEPLAADPVVRLDAGGRRVNLLLDPGQTRRQDHSYVFTFTADGSEQQGRRALTVDLVDLSGNAVTGLSAGHLTLDFATPTVVGVASLDRTFLKLGQEAHLDVTLSEPTPASPVVRMAPADTPPEYVTVEWGVEQGADPTSHRFTYQADTGDPEGSYLLWLHAVDEAGNDSGWVEVARVVLDFTPPGVAAPASVLPSVALVGRMVVVGVTLTEPVVGTPTLTGVAAERSVTFSPAENTGQLLSFFHVVEEAEDGVYALHLEGLVDRAGNQTASASVGEVRFDGTPPDLVGYAQNLATLAATHTLEVVFSASEVLGADPVVKFGSLEMTREGPGTVPYLYRLPMAATDLVGTYSITVDLVDAVGNRRFVVAGSAWVDAVAPRLLDAFFTPPVARLGITAYLSLTVSEPLAGPPTLGWDPRVADPGFTFVARSGLTYTYGTSVGQGMTPGVYPLRDVGLSDPTGNHVLDHPADLGLVLDFTVDNVPPRVTNLLTSRERYSAVGEFKSLVLTFDCSEAVDEAPGSLEVTLAGVLLDCGTYQSTSPNYRCQREMTAEEPEGLALLAAVATDRAGNVGVGNAAVELDFSAPALLSSSASPRLVKRGQTLFYAVTANEPLGAVPVLTVGGPGHVTLEYQDGTEYVFSHTVAGGSHDGLHPVSVDLVDLVGNEATGLVGRDFTLDGSPPVVSLVGTNRSRYSAQPGFRDLSLFFDLDDDRATVDAWLGSRALDCGPHQAVSPNRACTAVVAGVPGDDRVESVLVHATDDAGNVGVGNASVALDFTPPQVVSGSEDLRLVPPPGNPLTTVTCAGVGTRALVAFNVTEPLLSPPLVVESNGAVSLDFVNNSGSFYRFELPVDEDTPEGTHPLDVTLVDLVGNTSTDRLAVQLEVDRTSPSAPRTDLPDAVVYTRVPWGANESAGAVQMRVAVAAGATGGEGTLLVYSAAGSTGAELGRMPTRGDGSAGPLVLLPADRPQVFVAFADKAGNVSPVVPVLDGEWVVTMGGKIPGRTVENPHRLVAHERVPLALDPPGSLGVTSREVGGDAVALGDGVTVSVAGNGRQWSVKSGAPYPGPRTYHAMVYDAAQGRMVVFGGFYANTRPVGVWQWDGFGWEQSTPSFGPAARYRHAMVYDSRRGVTVLFGGGAADDDTWTWDGTSWQKENPVSRPSLRDWHAMAYDSRRGRTVLFGGEWWPEFLSDTWEWDGTAWVECRPAHRPAPRRAHAMAYDEARGEVVLYGGDYATNETWLYDGQDWRSAAPANSPPELVGPALAYDASRERIVLVGRTDAVWEWDGLDWTAHRPTYRPPQRANAALAYEAARGEVVLTGGDGDCPGTYGACGDVWEWNGTRWRDRTPVEAPAARMYFPFAYDSVREKTVLFSGWYQNNQPDTWTWDGYGWQRESPTVSPPKIDYASGAFDAVRGEFVVHGSDPTSWAYDGVTWRSASGPPRRYYAAMASTDTGVVLFGGSAQDCPNCSQTWTWDGVSWEMKEPPRSPPGRMHHAMGYDFSRRRVVLYGGYSGGYPNYVHHRDTWEWDGALWHEVVTAVRPPNGVNHGFALAYDSKLERMVLLVSAPVSYGNSQLWEWDGADWTLSPIVPELGGYFGQRMAYDTARARLVAFGAQSDTTTALFDMGADSQPGWWARVSLAAANLPPGTAARSLSVTAVVRGTGMSGSNFVDGVQLRTWERGRWLYLADDSVVPGILSWSTSATDVIDAMRTQDALNFLVAPVGRNGTSKAAVDLDYAEVRLKYRVALRGALSVTVSRASDGSVVSGVTVVTAPYRAVSVTDGTGTARFPGFPAGSHRVEAIGADHAVAVAPDVVVNQGETTVVRLVLVELGGLMVRLQAAGDIEWASARIHNVTLDVSIQDGERLFSRLPAGAHVLEVHAGGYATVVQPVTVVDGQVTPVTVELQPGTEICGNGMDDDNAYGADCEDPACFGAQCTEICDEWLQ